jgi:hypothetical protein
LEKIKEEESMSIKIYCLYGIDKHGRPKFHGRYASKHRMEAAALGLGLSNWFYEIDEKQDEFGGTINITEALGKKTSNA